METKGFVKNVFTGISFSSLFLSLSLLFIFSLPDQLESSPVISLVSEYIKKVVIKMYFLALSSLLSFIQI